MIRMIVIAAGVSLLAGWVSAQDATSKPASAPAPQAKPGLLKNVEFGQPVPANPYYHFKADLDIPHPGMLQVQVTINGEKLRLVSLKDASEKVDPNRPLTHYRPSFADTYAFNNIKYDKPMISGWLAWQSGKKYEIQVTVKLKKEVKDSAQDEVFTDSVTATAPEAALFDPAWKNYKAVVLSESAGESRQAEPVDLVLAFYADEAANLKNDLRVVAVDPKTFSLTEIPSQAYDIKTDVVEGDPREPNDQGMRRQVQIWVPTVTARVVFQADVPAMTSKVFLIYHNNPGAKPPQYPSDLATKGATPGLPSVDRFANTMSAKEGMVIENDKIKIALHPHSGVLDELILKSKPGNALLHRKETNGSIHWAPEAYPPPRPWTHTSDWKESKFDMWKGPVAVTTYVRGSLPYIPEVDAAVSYQVYPGLPYIISTTSTRVNESVAVQALRNGEIVFQRGLLTHLAWFDLIEGKIKTVDLDKIADLDEILMDIDTPWLSFFNPKTGIGFGGIQIKYANGGLEHPPRVLNPYYYGIVGPVVYWSRAMNFTFASSASQLMVDVPRGSFFWEKWAFVLYEPKQGDNAHDELVMWHKKLTNPLRVRLVEEAESRVPTVGTEIYIDPSKTGWEGRETLKPKK